MTEDKTENPGNQNSNYLSTIMFLPINKTFETHSSGAMNSITCKYVEYRER